MLPQLLKSAQNLFLFVSWDHRSTSNRNFEKGSVFASVIVLKVLREIWTKMGVMPIFEMCSEFVPSWSLV